MKESPADASAKAPIAYPLPVPYETASSQFVDPFLRHYGFVILARPRMASPIWALGGQEFLQPDAVRHARELHKRRKTAASLMGCD